MTTLRRRAFGGATVLALLALAACGRQIAGTPGAPAERRWVGSFRPVTLGTTGAGVANHGTALLVPTDDEPVLIRYELRLTTPVFANRTVSWALLDGRCDVPSLPMAAPGDFPPIDVPTSGSALATGDLAVTMTPGREYHVNLYFGRRPPVDHSSPVMCATLEYSGRR